MRKPATMPTIPAPMPDEHAQQKNTNDAADVTAPDGPEALPALARADAVLQHDRRDEVPRHRVDQEQRELESTAMTPGR